MKGPVALHIQDLRLSFGTKMVLDGVELELQEGELIGIFGHSGSGKSVLLRSVIGLERADSGHIFFEGRDLAALDEQEFLAVRTKIGYVFQGGALFSSMSVGENLAYPLRLHTDWDETRIARTVSEQLAKMGLAGTEALFPDELSGGMTKRAGLLRATMLRPRITLFDEPTSGLDPMNVRKFAHTVRELRSARPITGLFVTHDIHCAIAICDRIGILYEGRIHALDTVDTITKSDDPIVRSFVDTDYTRDADAGQ